MFDKLHSEASVIRKASGDPAFRRRLLAEPVRTLRTAGIDIPDGMSVRVVQDTPNLLHIVLPAVEPEGFLADHELADVSGGRCIGTETR